MCENAFGGGIQFDDSAGMVNCDDGVQRHAHDGALARLVFAQGIPNLFSVGDIFRDSDHAIYFPGVIVNGERPVLYPPNGAIGTDNAIDLVIFPGTLFGHRGIQNARPVVGMNGVNPFLRRERKESPPCAPKFVHKPG